MKKRLVEFSELKVILHSSSVINEVETKIAFVYMLSISVKHALLVDNPTPNDILLVS